MSFELSVTLVVIELPGMYRLEGCARGKPIHSLIIAHSSKSFQKGFPLPPSTLRWRQGYVGRQIATAKKQKAINVCLHEILDAPAET